MTALGGRIRRTRTSSAARIAALAAMIVVGACTIPPLSTPTPRPTSTPSPTPSPTPTPQPPTPTPDATPDAGAIPDFAAGEIVASLIDGLRVRQRPGIEAATIGLLPRAAELQVVMGPFPVDDFGWYLVADADAGEPQFGEGWVAAGYEPDPFLRVAGRVVDDHPFVASMAGFGDAEEGPIDIGPDDHAIRWIAADPERRRCSFGVSLTPAGGEAVTVIRAAVGGGLDRGTLQPQTFDAFGVRGLAFASVASDCDWALVVLRVPTATPDPSGSVAP